MKKYWLIALLIVIDVLAIATRSKPLVITRTQSTSGQMLERQRLMSAHDYISKKADSLQYLLNKISAEQNPPPPVPLTAIDRVVRIRCTKSGYSRTISDGTALHYEWSNEYFMVLNADSVTIYGRVLGEDCEVTRGNI